MFGRRLKGCIYDLQNIATSMMAVQDAIREDIDRLDKKNCKIEKRLDEIKAAQEELLILMTDIYDFHSLGLNKKADGQANFVTWQQRLEYARQDREEALSQVGIPKKRAKSSTDTPKKKGRPKKKV